MSKPRNAKRTSANNNNNNATNNNNVKPGGTSGTAAPVSKRKNRKNIALAIKLEIIRRLEQGQSNSSICHEFQLPSSTVSTIRSKKEQIKAFCKNNAAAAAATSTMTSIANTGGTTGETQYYQLSYPPNGGIEEVEGSLHRWINDRSFSAAPAKITPVSDTKNHLGKKSSDSNSQIANGSSPSSSSNSSSAGYNHNNNNNNELLIDHHNEWPVDDDVIQVETHHNRRTSSRPDHHHHRQRHHLINAVDQISYINEPITVITEEESEIDDDIAISGGGGVGGDTGSGNIINNDDDDGGNILSNNLENDITELFWGKVVSSIFNGRTEKSLNRPKRLDAKSLALIFKLSEAIVNILESKDPQKKRFMVFKQNLQEILQPYREIYNHELSAIRGLFYD